MDFWELTLLDEEAARAFIEDEYGCATSIRNVTSITLEAAKLLVEEFDKDLYLCSITSLTGEIASVLAKHLLGHNLFLNENFEWTADLAKIFINGYRIPKAVDRDPLTNEEAARCDSPLEEGSHAGRNHSPQVLQVFSKFNGLLDIKMDTLSKGQVAVLGDHENCLCISSLDEISPEVASCLAKQKRGELKLIGDFEITEEVASALSEFVIFDEYYTSTTLHLEPGKLTDAAARKLSKIETSLSLAIRTVDQTLETIAALAMSGSNGTKLIIPNLSCLTEPIAEALATYRGGTLNLNQEKIWGFGGADRGSTEIKEICEASAKALSKFKGNTLILPIEHISAKVAHELSQFDGELNLTGLHELNDDAAENFATGKSSVKLYFGFFALPTSGTPMKISDHARELLGQNSKNTLPPLPDEVLMNLKLI